MKRGTPVDVTLVTGPGCPLCQEARAALHRIGSQVPLRVQERSIDTALELAERFRHEIPVVLVQGQRLSKGKVNESRLAKSLAARLEKTG